MEMEDLLRRSRLGKGQLVLVLVMSRLGGFVSVLSVVVVRIESSSSRMACRTSG